MAYEMKVDGMAAISEQLSQLEDKAPAVAAMALYDGAGIMANEVRKSAEAIKTGPGSGRNDARYATPEEKEIVLKAAAGIAKFRKNGTEVDTSVGFRNAGYTQLNGKTVPIPLIVNSINSGTSFMHKQPFIRKASNSGAKKAIKKMQETVETEWQKIYRETIGNIK